MGQATPRHLGGREGGGRGGEFARGGPHGRQVRRHAPPPIEHARDGAAETADLDGVEVQRGQVVAQARGRQPPRVGLRARPLARHKAIERQPQALGRPAIVRGRVDQLRLRPGLLAERRQPRRPGRMVFFPVAEVENHQDRLIGLHRGAEKLLDGRIVVFLLRQHGDQDVGGLADRPGALPIDRHVGIDVGRVEEQEPRGHQGPAPPIETVLRGVLQRIVRGMPGVQGERREQPRQQRRVVLSRRHEADGMLGAGGQRADGAGDFAGQVVEDHRLADIGSAHHGHNQQRRHIELGQQFALEQVEPFLSCGRGQAHGRRRRFQVRQRRGQGPDVVGEGVVTGGWGCHVGDQGPGTRDQGPGAGGERELGTGV